MAREHPQGAARHVGAQVRYLILSRHGCLGAFGFAASALMLAARDRWIGWDPALEYLRSFGLFGLWQLWQSSGPGGRVHFMIAEKSSDVKVQRVSRLAESKTRCCISHDFGGFYQIIPCIRPAVVQIKVAHGCPATIRIFILGRAVQAWQRESGGRPMPPAMEAKGARSTIRERGNRGQGLSP